MAPEVTQAPKQVRIGEYILTRKIGQGGIAEIYKGRQESLNREVAIKILSAKLCSDPDLVRRFERESMVIARLNHPNIVHVIDRGQAGNRYFFAMEYVDGTSLKEVMAAEKIPLKRKLEMIADVCKGLDYAHKNGVIHRDIKPANILIDRQGNPRVADFGIAQIVGSVDGEVTGSGVIMGTVAYMSPEQKESSTNVDHTTDIYAIGVILYEMLTGRKPLGRFKMPSEVNPETPAVFDTIVQTCLAQEPKDRYQTAIELKNAILEAIGGARGGETTEQLTGRGSDSFTGKCRYLDTLKETRFASTILVENRVNKRLYVIKKHTRGEAGRKEAKLLSSLKNEHVIGIVGAGGDAKSTVIITEYAQGGSLADRMVRKYEWRKAMEITLDIADGVHAAHKNNLVHGNLRPSNILFDSDETVRVTDFGMPAHYQASDKTNWYAPPEHKQSRQGDIYAIGVILHQLLTGRRPEYDAGDRLLLADVRRDLPEAVVDLLGRLLAIRVGRRYASLDELFDDWAAFEEQLREADRQHQLTATPSVPAKNRLPRWILAAALAGGLGIIALLLYLSTMLG